MSNVLNRLALNLNGLFSLNNLIITRNLRIKSLRYLSDKGNGNNDDKGKKIDESSSSSSSSGESSSDDEKEKKPTSTQMPLKLIYKNTFISMDKKGSFPTKQPVFAKVSEKKFVPPTQRIKPDSIGSPKFERKPTNYQRSSKDQTATPERPISPAQDFQKKDALLGSSKPKYEKFSFPKMDRKDFSKQKDERQPQKEYKKGSAEFNKPKFGKTAAIPQPKQEKETINLSKPKGTVETKSDESSELKDSLGKLAKLLDSKQPKEKTERELLEPLTKKPDASQQIYNETQNILSSMKIDDSTPEDEFFTIKTSKTKSQNETIKKKEDEAVNRMELIQSIMEEVKNFPTIDPTRRLPQNQQFSDEFNQQFRRARKVTSSVEPTDDKSYEKAKVETPFEVYQNLKAGQPLNIFVGEAFKPSNPTSESKIWTTFREERLKELTYVPPLNGFEEAIQLTNEGKLWHFPIDNEQGLNNEDYKMPFYEHVLLDHYLEEFPDIKEIQNFMKLVLHALSNNPFLTVKEKKETIDWYKNYFDDKISIIEEAIRIEKYEASGGL